MSDKDTKIANNIAYTKHSMRLMSYKPLNLLLCTPRELQKRCVDYLTACEQDEIRPTIAGFAFALGMTRQTLLRYVSGETACPIENYEVLERFYSMLNAMMENFMQEGTINNISGIFLLKNNFGYKDQQDFVVNNKQEEVVSEDTLLEEADLLTKSLPKLADLDDE